MRRLPIVRIGASAFFVDERLRQIRNVHAAEEFVNVSDAMLALLLRESDGGVWYVPIKG